MPAATACSAADEAEAGDEHGPCRGFWNGDGINPVDDDVFWRVLVRVEAETGFVITGSLDQHFALGEEPGFAGDHTIDGGYGDGLAENRGGETGIAQVREAICRQIIAEADLIAAGRQEGYLADGFVLGEIADEIGGLIADSIGRQRCCEIIWRNRFTEGTERIGFGYIVADDAGGRVGGNVGLGPAGKAVCAGVALLETAVDDEIGDGGGRTCGERDDCSCECGRNCFAMRCESFLTNS